MTLTDKEIEALELIALKKYRMSGCPKSLIYVQTLRRLIKKGLIRERVKRRDRVCLCNDKLHTIKKLINYPKI
jgi:hypothetical protein